MPSNNDEEYNEDVVGIEMEDYTTYNEELPCQHN